MWLISFLFYIRTCSLDLLKIIYGSGLNELPGIWICRLTQIMRWVLPLLLVLPFLLITLVGRCPKSRRKALTSLIVLALIVSGSVFLGWMYSEAEREQRREREDWLRRNQYPRPRLWWNFSSASGFDLNYRGDERMLMLLRGETDSIELFISTNACRLCPKLNACEINIYGTLVGSRSQIILPPGVRVTFTPPNVNLPAGGNVSVLQTIAADPDAPTGCYYYSVGIRLTNSTEIGFTEIGFDVRIWLVIGPYTPHGNFSLIGYPIDFIARDELFLNYTLALWMKYNLSWWFTIRSEGPPLNVTLQVVNVDMPKEVKFPPPQHVFVPAESQLDVYGENINPNASLEAGKTYHFKVIAKSGNETHVANFEVSVIP